MTDICQGRIVAQTDPGAVRLHSQAPPQSHQIRRHRGVFHLRIQVLQYGDADGSVSRLQHALDGAPYISASIDYAIDPRTGMTNSGMRRIMLRMFEAQPEVSAFFS